MFADSTSASRPAANHAAALERSWWVFLLVLGLPFLLRLGSAPLFDVDEGAFAQASREMLFSLDLGHTTLNGTDRFDKPIAVYWLQAALMAVLGQNEWAARAPSALCAWVMCVAVAQFAREQWGREAGWWSAGMLATSAGMLIIGRAATADALLHLCLALTALDLCRHLQSGRLAPLRRAAVWIGLGLLAKGPVALLLPGAAWLLWLISSRRAPQARSAWRALLDPLAWALLLVVSLPWYIYAWVRHGQAFIEGFLLKHNIERFSAPMEGHAGGLLYFVVLLPLLWLPWSGLLVPVVRRIGFHWAEESSRFFLLWAGFVVVFFSLSGTKLPHYVLYANVPLALLMARQAVHSGPWMRAALWLGMLVWAAVLVGVPWSVGHWAQWVSDPLYRSLAIHAQVPDGFGWSAVVVGAALLCAVLMRGPSFSARALSGAGALALFMASVTWPWTAETLQGPVKRAAVASGQHQGQAVQWNVHWPSVGFYRQDPVPRRPPRPGEMAFVRWDRWEPSDDFVILYREHVVGLVRMKEVAP